MKLTEYQIGLNINFFVLQMVLTLSLIWAKNFFNNDGMVNGDNYALLTLQVEVLMRYVR